MCIYKIITLIILSFGCLLKAGNPERIHIAVFPFKSSGIDTDSLLYFVELLRKEISKSDQYEVMEYSVMKSTLSYNGYVGEYNCHNDECAYILGEFLAVNKVVQGILKKKGNIFFINMRFMDLKKEENILDIIEHYSGTFEELRLFKIPKLADIINRSALPIPIPKKCMEYPENFIRPLEYIDITKTKKVIRGKPWIVYSDRKKNLSMKKPGGKTAFYELNFLNRFYVAAENRKKDSIMIVQDSGINGLNFSGKAKSYGWVSKKDMLLWHNCLVSFRGGLDKKAMIVNQVDFKNNKDTLQGKSDIVTFYEDPELQYKTDIKSRMFHIRFVYKYDERNKTLLLGTDSKMVGNRPWETILGWVPENRLTLWDTRICIEPNWDPRAAIERQREQKKAIIFENFQSAFSYQNGEQIDQKSIFWDNDPFSDRKKGNLFWFRFPILASINNSAILHVGAMGSIENVEGKEIQPYIKAFTPYRINNMKYPLYKYILFLSRRELYDIITVMGDLGKATKGKDLREGLYNIWINILTKHIGNVNKNIFKEYTLEKAHKEICRLIGFSDDFKLIKDVKLKDITKRRVITDRLLDTYVSYIQKKYKLLTTRFDKPNNEDMLVYGDDVYYWVEADLLP